MAITIREAIVHDLPLAADFWNAIVKESWNEDWDVAYPNWRSMFLAIVEKIAQFGLDKLLNYFHAA